MADIPVEAPAALQSIMEALLIGLLVGAQREAAEGVHPGLRDFLLIGLAGGVCGLLQNPWLTVAALISITVVLAVYHFELRGERTGVTTELAGVATFCLTFLTATPNFPAGAPIAIGATIVVAAFLEFKSRLQTFFRDTITQAEFNNTLAFLAVVFVIYPLLPAGTYGAYAFFSPRQVWLFVILVSSISYVGYFMQRFIGAERGLAYASILGGLASTLATTMEFARRSRREPKNARMYARAAALANVVQFPRTLFILYAVNPALGTACLAPLGVSTLVGLAIAWWMFRGQTATKDKPIAPGNPFRLQPALTFGALFAAVMFLSKAANAELGWRALYATSALGGLVDPGAVGITVADLFAQGKVTQQAAVVDVLVALAANIAFKTAVALFIGERAFAVRLVAALAAMFGSGVAAWIYLL